MGFSLLEGSVGNLWESGCPVPCSSRAVLEGEIKEIVHQRGFCCLPEKEEKVSQRRGLDGDGGGHAGPQMILAGTTPVNSPRSSQSSGFSQLFFQPMLIA